MWRPPNLSEDLKNRENPAASSVPDAIRSEQRARSADVLQGRAHPFLAALHGLHNTTISYAEAQRVFEQSWNAATPEERMKYFGATAEDSVKYMALTEEEYNRLKEENPPTSIMSLSQNYYQRMFILAFGDHKPSRERTFAFDILSAEERLQTMFGI